MSILKIMIDYILLYLLMTLLRRFFEKWILEKIMHNVVKPLYKTVLRFMWTYLTSFTLYIFNNFRLFVHLVYGFYGFVIFGKMARVLWSIRLVLGNKIYIWNKFLIHPTQTLQHTYVYA